MELARAGRSCASGTEMRGDKSRLRDPFGWTKHSVDLLRYFFRESRLLIVEAADCRFDAGFLRATVTVVGKRNVGEEGLSSFTASTG
jgi:hypothetical protein